MINRTVINGWKEFVEWVYNYAEENGYSFYLHSGSFREIISVGGLEFSDNGDALIVCKDRTVNQMKQIIKLALEVNKDADD